MTHHVAPCTVADATPAPFALAADPAPSALADVPALADALARVARAIDKRNTSPVLSHVVARGHGDHLTLAATDLDVTVTVTVPCAADAPLALAIPAKPFTEMVKAEKKAGSALACLTAGERACASNESGTIPTATVESDASRATFDAIPAADWPDLPGPESIPSHVTGDVPRAELLHALATCEHAASTEETRYYLNGVFMEWIPDGREGETGGLVFTATDGHRLAHVAARIPFPRLWHYDPRREACGVILPRVAIKHMISALKAKTCPPTVRLALTDTRARLVAGAVDVLSKLIDGTFPDYRRVMPTTADRTVTVDRRAFREAVKAAASALSDRGRVVRLAAESDRLTVDASNPDGASASRSIPATADLKPSEPDFEIGFNARYLDAMCGALASDTITLRFQDAGSPMRVDDGAVSYVLMPMRI